MGNEQTGIEEVGRPHREGRHGDVVLEELDPIRRPASLVDDVKK
jgi:hypothetical protein